MAWWSGCPILQKSGAVVPSLPLAERRPQLEKFLKEKILTAAEGAEYFSQADVYGYKYSVPLRQSKTSTLVCFHPNDSSEHSPVFFGDLVAFVKPKNSSALFAIVEHRQIVGISTEPFFVCVEKHFPARVMNLVNAECLICPCSEFVFPFMANSSSMVLFHQASQFVRKFF